MKIIVFLITEDWYFYSHRINLAKEAIKSGFKVYLLSNVNEHKDKIERNGIKVIVIKILGLKRRILFIIFLPIYSDKIFSISVPVLISIISWSLRFNLFKKLTKSWEYNFSLSNMDLI